MAWETRCGQKYYYRKVRVGKTVRSEYFGRGEGARIVSELYGKDPVDAVIDQQVRADQRDYEESIENEIDELQRKISALVHEGLIRCGFRMHRGQWRKERHEKS